MLATMHMHTYRDGSLNTVGASLKVAADFVAATPPCAHSELDVYRSSGESMTSHSMRAREQSDAQGRSGGTCWRQRRCLT